MMLAFGYHAAIVPGDEPLATLKQLANPGSYRACDADLTHDTPPRQAWVALFREHVDDLVGHVREAYPDASQVRLDAFAAEYRAALHVAAHDPLQLGRVDILALDELRQAVQRRYGFDDPYLPVKLRATDAALADLPQLLDELDAAGAEAEVELLARGLMAGNLFDLGAKVTAARYRADGHPFFEMRAALAPRPWFVDHIDAWRQRWRAGHGVRHAVFFVDNAGGDICLGCLPLARWMVRHGTRVTLAANTGPALNDITAGELVALLDRIADLDAPFSRALREDQLRVVATGTGAPLLDLTTLSDECVAATADADVLLFHGMGRSLESNRSTRFTCDVLRTAVVKDELVAERIGAKLMDCVFRFEAEAHHSSGPAG